MADLIANQAIRRAADQAYRAKIEPVDLIIDEAVRRLPRSIGIDARERRVIQQALESVREDIRAAFEAVYNAACAECEGG